MIRINLLPVSERKRERRLKLPSFSVGGPVIVWAVGIVAVYVGMILAVATLQARSIRDLESKIEVAKKEAAELAPQLERIRKLTKEREEVNRRLSVIAELDRDRYFRVKLLNDIASQLPGNMWLTLVKETSPTSLSMEGVTFSNYLVADMMANLERSERFQVVDLGISEEGHIMEHRVVQFKLDTQVANR